MDFAILLPCTHPCGSGLSSCYLYYFFKLMIDCLKSIRMNRSSNTIPQSVFWLSCPSKQLKHILSHNNFQSQTEMDLKVLEENKMELKDNILYIEENIQLSKFSRCYVINIWKYWKNIDNLITYFLFE